MHRIAINHEGRVFSEPFGSPLWQPLVPTPLIFAATVVRNPSGRLVPGKGPGGTLPFIFREHSYDPVSRVRRGNFYWRDETPSSNISVTGGGSSMWVTHYSSRPGSNVPECCLLPTMVSLRGRSTFGVLPRTYDAQIREKPRGDEVLRRLDSLAEDIHRASPISVIDRAREVATAILASDCDKSGADLSKLLDQYQAKDKVILKSAGQILARLHARDKTAERGMREMPLIAEQDAELAVLCVGTLLRELGWAEW